MFYQNPYVTAYPQNAIPVMYQPQNAFMPNNMPNNMQNNMNMNQQYQQSQPMQQGQYSQQPQQQQPVQPQPIQQNNQMQNLSIPTNQGISSTDIIWIKDEQEVMDYPITAGNHGLFMNIDQMKLYTKDGSTGLIRDFDLCESQESIQRYQQFQQTQNMQFPIVDTSATVVDTGMENQRINELEQKLEEKFNKIEERLDSVVHNLSTTEKNETKTRTVGKSMAKKG